MAEHTIHSVLSSLSDPPLPTIIAGSDYGTYYTFDINYGWLRVKWTNSRGINFPHSSFILYPVDPENDYFFEIYYRLNYTSYQVNCLFALRKGGNQCYGIGVYGISYATPYITVKFIQAGNVLPSPYTSNSTNTWIRCTYSKVGSQLYTYINGILWNSVAYDDSEHSGLEYNNKPLFQFYGSGYSGSHGQLHDFKMVCNCYQVTYDGNGETSGSVPIDTNYYVTYDNATVLTNSGGLTKTGYSFGGWNTMSDGSGATYAPGSTYPINLIDVTLYALWIELIEDVSIVNSKTFVNRKVHFRSQSGTTFLWEFGDGATSDKNIAWHVYTKPGIYTITLTIDGYKTTLPQQVIVFESSFILDAGALYINYGEKGQMLLGATEGGNLFGIDQDYRHMTFDTVDGELTGSHRLINCVPKIIANIIELNYRLLNIINVGSHITFNSGSIMIGRAIRKLLNNDYIKNIAIVAEHGGTGCFIVCKILNGISIEAIEMPFEDTKETVIEVTFTGCFSETDYDNEPWQIDIINNN